MATVLVLFIVFFLSTVSYAEEGPKELLDWIEKTERFALFPNVSRSISEFLLMMRAPLMPTDRCNYTVF